MRRIAYKLLRIRKDGSLGSLFINKQAKIPVHVWLQAEDHPTKGYARRFGWHATVKPEAPHLTMKNRVWFRVEIEDYISWDRPQRQGGKWFIAQRMKVLDAV